MLCTLVRGFLTNEEWSKYQQLVQNSSTDDDQLGNKEILVSFPEKEVRISKKEFKFFAPYHENEQIMRLLTGQLLDSYNSNRDMSQQKSNEQMEILSKMMQNNPGGNNMQAMQNLMNSQGYGGGNANQNLTSNTGNNNMMASMMSMGNQSQNPLFGMGSGMQSQTPQNGMNPQNTQLISNLMSGQMQNNPNMQWTMSQMAAMGGDANNMDKSFNDLISSQMMNYNGNHYLGQDKHGSNMNTSNQKNPYNQNQGN